MARNLYFSEKVRSEMDLYEDLVIEALKIYGQDIYYLPREIVNEDDLLGDDVASRFPQSHKIEMYIENVEGFDGEGDLFTRFGVEIRDEVTLVVSKRRFEVQVRRPDNAIQVDRPAEGDLIWIPLTNKMFEIQHVEHEQPFYQIENIPVYKLRCTLFEYTGEDFDTSITAIQDIEKEQSYQYKISVDAPKKPTVNVTQDSNGLITGLTLVQGGRYYTSAPTVKFIGGTPIDSATATATVSGGSVSAITLDSAGYYTTDSDVTIAFTGGTANDSDYDIGDTVKQVLSGNVTITGEVQRRLLDSSGDSSFHIFLSHVGADDGLYHTFSSGGTLLNQTNNSTTGLTINNVIELNNINIAKQNDEFSNISDDFLDFSENNPFGDPENQ